MQQLNTPLSYAKHIGKFVVEKPISVATRARSPAIMQFVDARLSYANTLAT